MSAPVTRWAPPEDPKEGDRCIALVEMEWGRDRWGRDGLAWRRPEEFMLYQITEGAPGTHGFLPLPLAPFSPTLAANDVLAERQRQISAEGWTPEHDDAEHDPGDLADAAICYAMFAADTLSHMAESCDVPPVGWPFDRATWKPTTPRRDLVKAGALILAEIERLDREADLEKALQAGGA